MKSDKFLELEKLVYLHGTLSFCAEELRRMKRPYVNFVELALSELAPEIETDLQKDLGKWTQGQDSFLQSRYWG
ncbi:hypothetical protein [Breoghania sp.]|uniref:hypothetical protein n=1 Tax=Breoghania sp. TaxID=2065378 RepID=UPI002AAAB143|nr:hypothetical protein [Breoghania sp.]